MQRTTTTSVIIALTILLAIPAYAAPANNDPSYPTKYLNERAVYRGEGPAVPAGSSSAQLLATRKKLGDSFPKSTLSPSFAGRITGFATIESVTTARAAPKTATPKFNAVTGKAISGKLSKFPNGRLPPHFAGRWSGDSRSHVVENSK